MMSCHLHFLFSCLYLYLNSKMKMSGFVLVSTPISHMLKMIEWFEIPHMPMGENDV
jgi:hypothetical protein